MIRSPFKAFLLPIFAAAIALACCQGVAAQTRMIELEVFVDDRAPLGTAQEWLETLNSCGANRITLKTGRPASPSIEENQLGNSSLILVKGIIDRNRLRLPGGSFAITDRAGITALLKRLRDDGSTVALAEKMAFGLTAPQLVELNDQLSKPVNFSTKGASVRESLQQISRLVGHAFQIDPKTVDVLAGGETIPEELQGLSAGTAIAIMIRPLGLVLQPERQPGQGVKLAIVDSRDSNEHWPIGWPPESLPVKVAPDLFQRQDLEIRSFSLQGTLDAIEKRTKVPFVYDHNTLARAGIEIADVKVTLVQNKITYMSALGKLLRQTKPGLIQELRVDEAGKSFLWISTMR